MLLQHSFTRFDKINVCFISRKKWCSGCAEGRGGGARAAVAPAKDVQGLWLELRPQASELRAVMRTEGAVVRRLQESRADVRARQSVPSCKRLAGKAFGATSGGAPALAVETYRTESGREPTACCSGIGREELG